VESTLSGAVASTIAKMSAPAIGALIGLVIGIGLSFYVARIDAQKRRAEMRVRVQYKGSLVIVPLVLAGIGGLIGVGIAAL
jgi:hypothetical protein